MHHDKTYLLVDMEAFPPGWTNVQRHNGHEVVLSTIGNQSSQWAELQTHSRVNMPTRFDEEGIVIENGATCEQFFLCGQVTMADSDDIIYAIAKGIWCESDEEPSEGQIAAVANKIEIVAITCEQAIAMVDNDPVFWGETGT